MECQTGVGVTLAPLNACLYCLLSVCSGFIILLSLKLPAYIGTQNSLAELNINVAGLTDRCQSMHLMADLIYTNSTSKSFSLPRITISLFSFIHHNGEQLPLFLHAHEVTVAQRGSVAAQISMLQVVRR